MGMEFTWIEPDETEQNIREFFKINEGELFTLVSSDNCGDEIRYTFKYSNDCHYSDEWECLLIHSMFMVQTDTTLYDYYEIDTHICFKAGDYIRLADADEIQKYNTIYDKYKLKSDERLIKKYNLSNKSELLEYIFDKLLNTDSISNTMEEILK